MPEYQKAEHYLTTYPPPYSSAVYNASGTSRAFLDMSANGCVVIVEYTCDEYTEHRSAQIM